MADLAALQSVVETVLGPLPKPLVQNDELCDMEGWDSIAALRIMLALENKYSIKLPVKEFVEARTVAELQKLIQMAL